MIARLGVTGREAFIAAGVLLFALAIVVAMPLQFADHKFNVSGIVLGVVGGVFIVSKFVIDRKVHRGDFFLDLCIDTIYLAFGTAAILWITELYNADTKLNVFGIFSKGVMSKLMDYSVEDVRNGLLRLFALLFVLTLFLNYVRHDYFLRFGPHAGGPPVQQLSLRELWWNFGYGLAGIVGVVGAAFAWAVYFLTFAGVR